MKAAISKSRISKKSIPAAMIDPENELEVSSRLERIATAAYYKAEARGFVPGFEMEDWLRAEAEVDAGTRQ